MTLPQTIAPAAPPSPAPAPETAAGLSPLPPPPATAPAVPPPEIAACAPGDIAAVIDIGSGSARAVVMQAHPGGGIEILAQQSVALNLMNHLDASGMLDAAGVAATLDALADFALVARAYGVGVIHAVATAALRESGNAAAVAAAARRAGIPLRIIDGAHEAAYCFIGAIHGLPVSDGLLADIGGGSAEIVPFQNRTMLAPCSLPLGSLRIANLFRLTDRPAPADLRAAGEYVRAALSEAEVPPLPAGAALVGSGGSVRLLSRLARSREEIYPIIKMHGYRIGAHALAGLLHTLSGLTRRQRAGMLGMNPERVHSIVGGAVVAHALAQHTAAAGILVSGQGLREGLARHPAPLPPVPTSAPAPNSSPAPESIRLPPLSAVRRDATIDLCRRFAPRFACRGERRADLAAAIAAVAWPPPGPADLLPPLRCAARLLDIGSAVDFYNRANRAASLVVRADLPGFTHRESAQIAAILLASENGRLPRRFRNCRLLSPDDMQRLAQAAVILTLADHLDCRLPPELPAAAVRVHRPQGTLTGTLTVRTPGWSPSSAPGLAQRWQETFGETIRVTTARGNEL